MGQKEVREALKTLTKEEKAWMDANPDHNKVTHLRILVLMASTYTDSKADEIDDQNLIRAIKDFKKWFKESNPTTPKNDKNQPTNQECE